MGLGKTWNDMTSRMRHLLASIISTSKSVLFKYHI